MLEQIHSPNYTKGRLLRSIKAVVVHSMAGYMQPSIDAFLRPTREASAHYLIGHDGREVQMVDEANTAWHCGALFHPFNNTDTIGIETEGGLIGDTVHPLGEEGHKTLARRISDIHHKYGWGEPSSRTVIMHRDMPGCKTACPTGVDILKVIQEAQDEYNGHAVNVPITEHRDEPLPAKEPFTVNLKPSQTFSKEVNRMQRWLVNKGYLTGVKPNEFGFYGKKTQAAVDAFQKANGIPKATQYGWWYDKTRAKANSQI